MLTRLLRRLLIKIVCFYSGLYLTGDCQFLITFPPALNTHTCPHPEVAHNSSHSLVSRSSQAPHLSARGLGAQSFLSARGERAEGSTRGGGRRRLVPITLGRGWGPAKVPAQTHGLLASSQPLGFISVTSVATSCPGMEDPPDSKAPHDSTGTWTPCTWLWLVDPGQV